MKKVFKGHIEAVVTFFYPVAAGIETNMLETLSVLASRGWNITVHTSQSTLTEKNILPAKTTISGLKVQRTNSSMFGFFPRLSWTEGSIISLHNFNVMPHFYILCIALLRILLGFPKVIIFLTPHGGFTPDWTIFPGLIASIKRFYHITIGAWLINFAVDQVRAVSEWEREQIIVSGVHPAKVVVISNGMENEAYETNTSKVTKLMKKRVAAWGKYMIQIGRIYPIKNYETTIRALAVLPPNINFVIVGPVADHKYLESLKSQVSQLGLTKRVFFAGVIRGSDKYYVIKKAQLMVHMARWESFCNAVHEGMSQRLPVIVANNTALPYLVKDGINGYCVDTFDSKALAEKINYILKNAKTQKIKTIQKTNREFGLKHSWTEVAGKIEVSFKDLQSQQKYYLQTV